jgi:lipopolysaccharide transport system permease protein
MNEITSPDIDNPAPISPTTEIDPPKKWVRINFHEIWEYRDLIYFFIWRDIKVRYKQTGLGVAWAVIQPLLTMIIFTLFFGGFAKIPSEGIPYPIFSFAALLPWYLFADGITRSTTSMVTQANIMTKVYFPRIISPLAGAISPAFDFFISFIILLLMMFYYGYFPTINLLLLPVFVILVIATSFALGLWLSALNILYRDFQYTVTFLVQIGMFVSPVVYAASLVPEKFQLIYSLNPMTGLIEGFRWIIVGTSPPGMMMFISIGVTFLLLISGIMFFLKIEQYYTDIV